MPFPLSLARRHCFPLASSILALACLVPTTSSGDDPPPQLHPRPHVLLIAVDDLRPFLGCYGVEHAVTPNIDRLAENGLLFERAYCQYAKCGPSRLSLLSGLRPESVGVFNHRKDSALRFRERRPDAVSLPRWFRDHGYEARGFGKIQHDGWDNSEDWSAPPFPGREGEMREIADPEHPGGPTVIAERFDCPVKQFPDVPDEHFFAGRMTTEVLGAMEQHRGEHRGDGARPLFLAVGYRRPHLPFVAPKRYHDLHEPDESWLAPNPSPPEGVPPLAWFTSGDYKGAARRFGFSMPDRPARQEAIDLNGFELRSYLGVPVRGPIPEDAQRELIRAYAACVSYVDAQVGRLLDGLDRHGLRENTLVVLFSDHGWHLGEHSVWAKMTNYEVGTRVPLILSAPGQPRGRTRALAELVDLYPTLCDLAGLPRPDHLEGESLLPVIEAPSVPGAATARSFYTRSRETIHGRAVRSDRFRYVRWSEAKTGRLLAEELYDHEADPHETRNLAGSPEREDELERMRELEKEGTLPVAP